MPEQQFCKRLIEVDLPIKRISEHARREKSIRYGHIATLHIWWARRPLAACRAVLCAALWPDPADPMCPDIFRKKAKELMLEWTAHERQIKLSTESVIHFEAARKNPKLFDDNLELRRALLDFIADFCNWDNSTVKEYLQTSRELTLIAHESLTGHKGNRPFVVDPFAGGGSIPFESLRIGADAFASDLNPVAILLNKVTMEYIPRYGVRLSDEIRKRGDFIEQEARKILSQFYPEGPGGETPIAYLWARTVKCEGPGCGAIVPLIRSLWLVKAGKRSVALKLIPDTKKKLINVEIQTSVRSEDVQEGTSRRGAATCPCCGYTTPATSVRKQLTQRSGGAQDARLLAIRQDDKQGGGRCYRLPNENDLTAAVQASKEMLKQSNIQINNLKPLPDEVLPIMSGVFNAPIYGHKTWGSLFSPRQALALITFSRLIRSVGEQIQNELKEPEFAKAVQTCLALALDRLADFNSSLCVLNSVGGRGVVHTFGRQALPMVWDFMETNPLNEVGANWAAGINTFETTIKFESANTALGHAECCSATKHVLPDDVAFAFITDPPYYNSVPYADLSDFFYVWLRRTVGDLHKDLFADSLAPKDDEACEMSGWDPVRYSHKDGKWFEQMMALAMSEGRRILNPQGVGVVVFAHKSTSGWETLLQAMIDASWMITGSWPIDTERPGRLRAQNSAALASSIHLVCRPRENPDGTIRKDEVGDWRDVLAELPRRISDWMPRLASEGVVGADAIFACLGPALEIFSKYARVEKANGEKVNLREYLEQVWGAVAKEALNMIFQGAHTEGFEEDARLTAMWLWTLSAGTNGTSDISEEDDESVTESNGSGKVSGFSLEFDAARKIAQGLGAHLDNLSSLVEIDGDQARLLPVAERINHLFGRESVAATPVRKKKKESQMTLFQELNEVEDSGWSLGDEKSSAGKTVLDRVHQAMLLFGAGRGDAMRRFLVEEGIGKDERFWRLAQALSALYPSTTDEKRWVDGVLARKKSLGF